jgi:hypothetical protein
MTPHHHRLVNAAMRRLGLTRADLLGLLVDKYAEVVALPHDLAAEDDDD